MTEHIKNSRDVVAALLIFILCGIGFYSTSQLPPASPGEILGPGAFPNFTLYGLLVAGAILFVRGIRHAPVKMAKTPVGARVILFFLTFLLYLAGIVLLGNFFIELDLPFIPYGGGFAVSTAAFLVVSLLLLGRRNPLEIILVPLMMTGTIIVIFGVFFEVILP